MRAKASSLKLPKMPKMAKIVGFFLFGVFIGSCLLAAFFTLAVLEFKREYQDRVYPGVFLSRQPVSGKTKEEMEKFLLTKESQVKQRKLVFSWEEGQTSWEITPAMIDYALSHQETINKVFTLGRRTDGLASLVELYRLFLFSEEVEPVFAFNEPKLEAVVASMSAVIDRPGQEAKFEFKEGKVVDFQTSQTGRSLDKDQTRRLVILGFSQMAQAVEKVINLDLPVAELRPKVATQQSNDLGIREALGEGESFFFDSIPSRIHNIGLASSRLHGVVVPPGEIFSFAQTIGEISSQTGYQQAYVIKEKKTILEDGGGVCQVSTTIFRAVLNAGLPIVERQPHYYRVGFYEQGGYPPGLDATVYPPSPDFKFKNDTPAYLLIQTNFDKAKKRLGFTIYGTSDGRRVEVAKPVIHSRTEPPEPSYIDDPTLPVGTIKQTDQAHPGAKVSFKRKVWTAGGELKEEREFWSDYVAWPAVFLRGTGQ